MGWLQVTFAADRKRAPLIETALDVAEALAVTLTDAGNEPQWEPPPSATPLWSEVLITGLFPGDEEARARAEQLAKSLAGHIVGEPRFEYVEDRPWERAWLDDLEPKRFGRRLWVCPTGQAPAVGDAVVVELDPGLAFGTGHHPTTALCLRWLDGAELRGKTVVDYGCGSGILAIAALRLGAVRAVAVDHDPQALDAAAANAAENGVSDRLHVCAPEVGTRPPADVLVANILATPLIQLARRFSASVRPGGDIVLSGILTAQTKAVSNAYAPWFDLETPRTEADWVLLYGHRKPSCP
jgi:ribosomal protein L11 methyltransferase